MSALFTGMDELNRQHLINVVKEYCGRQMIFFFKTSDNKKADGLKNGKSIFYIA